MIQRSVDPRRRRKELRTQKPRSIEGRSATLRRERGDESTRNININPLETRSLGKSDRLAIQISPHYNSKKFIHHSMLPPNKPIYMYLPTSIMCLYTSWCTFVRIFLYFWGHHHDHVKGNFVYKVKSITASEIAGSETQYTVTDSETTER